MLLAACATSNEPLRPAAPVIPPIASDLDRCRVKLSAIPDAAIDAGDVERDWKSDRAEAIKVNACLVRALCQYHQVRKDIGRVSSEPICN
jgi:hypothetical protein